MTTKSVYYTYDEKTKKYTGEHNAQIDPLESEKAGKTVYCGLPQNATYTKPLAEKEGFNVVWNDSAWEYQEIPQPEPEPEPTQEEKEYRIRSMRDAYLAHWDFSQLRDAPFTEEEKDILAEYRQYLRDYTKEENWWEHEPSTYEEWLVAHYPTK